MALDLIKRPLVRCDEDDEGEAGAESEVALEQLPADLVSDGEARRRDGRGGRR